MPAACTQPNVDRLIKILCAKKIRVGIRDYYPLFAERKGDRREGYEVDVALAIGRMLGVDVDFVRVNAATRIPRADVVTHLSPGGMHSVARMIPW